jgi:hypothetical protein
LWQGNRGKVSEKQEDSIFSTHGHDMLHTAESLPKDASQHHVAWLSYIGLRA